MGLAAFNRMRRMKAEKLKAEASAERQLKIDITMNEEFMAEAEKLGVDPQLYDMDEDELIIYAKAVYDIDLDKRKSHLNLVKEVMALDAVLDDAEEITELEEEDIQIVEE